MAKDITYTLSVSVTRSIISVDDTPESIIAEWMDSSEAKRELEREVLRALRVIDGDCDCEVMETETVDA